MPRPIINTPYTERPKLEYLIQEALGKILTESGAGILLQKSLESNIYTTRTIPTTVYN